MRGNFSLDNLVDNVLLDRLLYDRNTATKGGNKAMTRKEAYAVAEKLAFVDFEPQWIVRRMDEPDSYHVLGISDPMDVLGHLCMIENHIDPKTQDGQTWERATSNE